MSEGWQSQVMDLAIEISGGAPEAGDFNTAMIRLHHLVPSNVMDQLQARLVQIEGDPDDGNYDDEEDDFDDNDYAYDEQEEDCKQCGAPPGFCDCNLDY